MISSATKIRLKRSGVPGRVPTLADLQLGELGVNYSDGKIYFRQDNGEVDRIIRPGQTDITGNTFFVSVDGNDNNSGLNQQDTLRSVKAAAIKAQPGDSIKVFPGQYIEDNPITFRDRVSVEGMELRNVLVTPANPEKNLYLVGDGFHATNHSFVSNQDSIDGASIISFRPLEGTASDRYFDAARLLRDNLKFIGGEAVGFLTSGYSGEASGQRAHDGARSIQLNKNFLSEEAFQYIRSPDYTGPAYFNPDFNQCRSDLKDILSAIEYDLISDGNSSSTGAGLTYYAPIKFINDVNIIDTFYENRTGKFVIETENEIIIKAGDEVKLQDIRLDCPPYNNDFLLINFNYDNTTGVGTVTLPFIHDISVGESVKLEGLRFDCPRYGNQSFSVSNFNYNNETGSSLITVETPHGLSVNDTIELRDIQFDCPAYGGEFANVTDLTYDESTGIGTISYDTSVTFDSGDIIYLYDIKMDCPPGNNAVSISTVTYNNITGITSVKTLSAHGVEPGDDVKLVGLAFTCPGGSGITTTIFPADGDPEIFRVINTPSPDNLIIQVGPSSIVHEYVQGGNLITGITTNIFPDGTRSEGNRFEVITGIGTTQAIIEIGANAIPHTYVSGGRIQYGQTNEIPVIDAEYDYLTGITTVTVSGDHGLVAGNSVKLSNLEFSCPNGSGITTNLFPDGTAASFNIYRVRNIINANTFETNVGTVAFPHTYEQGGSIFVGITTNIFPDGTQGYTFTVDSVPSPTQVTIDPGISSIPHNYIRGGTLFFGRSNEREFVDFKYNNETGLARITFDEAQSLQTGDSVKLKNLEFTCPNGSGITTNIFPDGNKFLFAVKERLNPTQYNLNIGVTTIPHTWVQGTGEAFVGITTDIFPEPTGKKLFKVTDTPSPTQVTLNIGINSIPHTYLEGGKLFVGINTDIFPGDPEVSPLGDVFTVESVTDNNEIVINVGLSSIQHNYASGGKLLYGQTSGGQLQHITGPGVKEATVAAIDFESEGAHYTINNRPFGSFIPAETALVQGLDYNNVTGFAEVTAPGINAHVGDLVRLSDVQFVCSDEFSGVTTTFFPDDTRPDGAYFTVDSRIGINTFSTFIGISTIVHNYRRGGNAYRYNQSVNNVEYAEGSGIATITIEDHGYKKGDIVQLKDIEFDCNSFTPNLTINNFQYDNVSGLSTISTVEINNVKVGDTIKLDGIKFDCAPYGNDFAVQNALYDNVSGVATIITTENNQLAFNSRFPTDIVTASYDQVGKLLSIESQEALGLNISQDVVLIQGLEFDDGVGIVTIPVDSTSFNIESIESTTEFTLKADFGFSPLNYVGAGTAIKSNRLDVRLRDLRFDCPPNGAEINVDNLLYNNLTGEAVLDSEGPHNLNVGDLFKLADIQLSCPPYGNQYPVTGTDYDNVTGELTVTTSRGLFGLTSGDDIRLANLQFDGLGTAVEYTINTINWNVATRIGIFRINTTVNPGVNPGDTVRLSNLFYQETIPGVGPQVFPYPDGRDVSYNLFEVISSTPGPGDTWDFEIALPNVTDSTTVFQNVGEIGVGISTNIFPLVPGTFGDVYEIQSLNVNDFIINVGAGLEIGQFFRTINGGGAFTGITTNIFPDYNRQNSPKGNIFKVNEVISADTLSFDVGVSSIPHTYVSGGLITVGVTTNIFPDNDGFVNVIGIDSARQIRVNVGPTNQPHIYIDGGSLLTGITTNIFPSQSPQNSPLGNIFKVNSLAPGNDFIINVGTSTIPHLYQSGGTVTTGVTTNKFPDGTNGFEFPILSVLDENVFAVNVGASTIPHTYRTGGASRRVDMPVKSFDYDNLSGIATVGVTSHRINPGDLVKLRDVKFDCPAYGNTRGISTADYNNLTGILTIETTVDHNFSANEVIKLSGIQMDCPDYGNTRNPVSCVYNQGNDYVRVTVSTPHNLDIGDSVKIVGLEFEDPITSGITTIADPTNLIPSLNIFEVVEVFDTDEFAFAYPAAPRPQIYQGTGTVFVGITTNIFPNSAQNSPAGSFLTIVETPTLDTFTVNVGPSSIPHTYIRGGAAQPGITTDIFPDGTQGDFFIVREVETNDTFSINAGISTIEHTYNSGGYAAKYSTYQSKIPQVIDTSVIRVAGDCPQVVARTKELTGIITSIIESGPDIAPGGKPVAVRNAVYTPQTQQLSISTEEDTEIKVMDLVRIENILLEYEKDGELIQKFFPNDFDYLFTVDIVLNSQTFVIQTSLGDENYSYVSGGTVSPGRIFDITDANYNANKTQLTITTNVDNYFVKDTVLAVNDLVLNGSGGNVIFLGNPIVKSITNSRTAVVEANIGSENLTFVRGGTAASEFAQQFRDGIDLRTRIINNNIQRTFLAIAHDISRGGNWKCVEQAKRISNEIGSSPKVIKEYVTSFDYAINIARCVINNVTWGGVPRQYLTSLERRRNSLPPGKTAAMNGPDAGLVPQTPTSVVRYAKAEQYGDITTEQKSIIAFDYDKTFGIATVTTKTSHALEIDDAVQLNGLEFNCSNSPGITTTIFPDGTQGEIFEVISTIQDNLQYVISNVNYNNVTGEMIIESQGAFDNIEVGSNVKLGGIIFDCTSSGVPGTATYPSGEDYRYTILDKIGTNQVLVNVGISTIAHDFVPGIGYSIQEDSNKFTVHVGTVNFSHTYVGGGTIWKRAPFQKPIDASQLKDLSIQIDSDQLSNSTPAACRNVQNAIENCVGIVTTIIENGFENSGISTRYPGNNGAGVDNIELMPSQGVGNITKGPYIRNCTNFVPKSIGMRMDGFDAEPGDEIPNGVQGSSNVDSFTQFNPAGIGCSISNGTYQQLVSIFTICCDEAIVCDSGAQLDLTNSNSSFGRLGLVARGIGDSRSKCIDRYTGVVEEVAQIEQPVVVVSGLGDKRPYDGQGIFIGELFRFVASVEITDPGSGYDIDREPVVQIAPPTGPSGITAEVLPTVSPDGSITAINIISTGSQYRDVNPEIFIAPPVFENGRQAKAKVITEPFYYDVLESTPTVEGTSSVTFKQLINNTVSVGTTVFFSRLSLQIASSHSFEYIGSGNSIDGARPSQGGVPIKANEVIKEDGGEIVYTSTDQAGNFNIGDELVINQFTGTIVGRSFDQSVLNRVTPLIIALDS